jgi:hypothetical protein
MFICGLKNIKTVLIVLHFASRLQEDVLFVVIAINVFVFHFSLSRSTYIQYRLKVNLTQKAGKITTLALKNPEKNRPNSYAAPHLSPKLANKVAWILAARCLTALFQ